VEVEALEDRWLPSTIAGTVYHDLNSNGLFDPGEPGIAGVTVALQRPDGTTVATAVTDANGHYAFSHDPTQPGQPAQQVVDLNFASAKTNFDQAGSVAQFDPSLGQLQSVELLNEGSLTSHIQAESLDAAPSTVTATVSGSLDLQVGGADLQTNFDPVSANADVAAFDGTNGFTGPSGHDFGDQTANGSQTLTLDGSNTDLSAFIGTGTLQVTEQGTASSTASGPGNLLAMIGSTASAHVRVVYNYLKLPDLPAGDYTVVETPPAGWITGLATGNNVTTIIPAADGPPAIPVQLDSQDNSPNNDFGNLALPSLSGHVYQDANDNGARDPGDPGVAGVTVTLTGSDDQNNPVSQTTQTGADGSYSFTGLRPGTYDLAETPPAGDFNGATTAGSQGGTAGVNTITGITLLPQMAGVNNDFGVLLPSSVAGFVYLDANADGVKDGGEAGVAGIALTLTGVDDLGQQVSLMTTSGADGSYAFTNLRPGNYLITRGAAAGFLDGADTPGSLGGTVAVDQLGLTLQQGQAGVNYNFALLTPPPAPPPAPAVVTGAGNGSVTPDVLTPLPDVSKRLLTGDLWQNW
jgi:hypothetical protein